MMNLAKFGSPHLDTLSTRYGFLKFALKSVKTNKENIQNSNWQLGPAGQRDPHVSEAEQSTGFDRRELVDNEVFGDCITTTTLVSLSRIEGYPRLT